MQKSTIVQIVLIIFLSLVGVFLYSILKNYNQYPQLSEDEIMICGIQDGCHIVKKPLPIPVIRQSMMTGE